jgi:hypothetical protein
MSFRDAKPGLNSEQQQAAISPTKPGRLIRHGHQSLYLRSSQEIDQSAGLPFCGIASTRWIPAECSGHSIAV